MLSFLFVVVSFLYEIVQKSLFFVVFKFFNVYFLALLFKFYLHLFFLLSLESLIISFVTVSTLSLYCTLTKNSQQYNMSEC